MRLPSLVFMTNLLIFPQHTEARGGAIIIAADYISHHYLIRAMWYCSRTSLMQTHLEPHPGVSLRGVSA